MRGSVRRRGSPGSWEFRLPLGRQPAQTCGACGARHWLGVRPLTACPACGSEDLVEVMAWRERTQSGFRTQKAAQEALDRVKTSYREGDYVEPSKITVREFLTKTWLPAIEGTLKATTFVGYKAQARLYIIPALGMVRLQRLTPEHIGAMYADLAGKGRTRGRQTADGERTDLSATSVRHTAAALHTALAFAVRRRMVTRNACDAVTPPRPEHHEMKVWTAEEARAFLAHADGDRLQPLWHLLLATGLRRGEALGLRWSDIDVDRKTLAVRRSRVSVSGKPAEAEPKTGRSRVVALDDGTIEALQRQSAQQLADQQELGDRWQATGYVFTLLDGQPWHPDKLSAAFAATVAAAPVPRIRLHDLRHTSATLALRAGIHPKVVAERLGHSNVMMTLSIYSHVTQDMQTDAAALIGALISGS